MEFDKMFTVIQGRLLSAQKILNCKLVDIIKGQDEEFSQALTLIENAIKELNPSEDDHRRLHLLFLINTSFYSCSYIENDVNNCHLLDSIPKISDYLYLKLIIRMDWHKFLGETILYCPEFITCDILRYLEYNLNELDTNKAVPFINSLYENLFKKIIITDSKHKQQKMVKHFLNVIKFDFEEIIEKTEWIKDLKYQYWGYVNRMYLELTQNCVRFMKDPIVSKPDIYDFNVEYDYTQWPCSDSETNWGKHCIGAVATKVTESIKKVSVNMYMSWCEIDIPGSISEKTLQISVREAAYLCREAIKSFDDLYHTVAGLRLLYSTLECMALRPITEDEEIATADLSTLVINILNPKRTQVKWLRGLIDRGIFESAPYMKVVADNARLVDTDTCLLLLNKAVQYISSNSISQSDLGLVRETVFTCLRALPSSDLIKLLEIYLSNNNPINMLSSDNFESSVVLLLNKIGADNMKNEEIRKDIICLVIENAESFLRFCLRECLTSKIKSDIIVDIFDFVKPVFFINNGGLVGSQIANFIQRTDEEDIDQHRDICLYTMTSLCSKSLIDGKTFINHYIIPKYEECIKEKTYSSLKFYQELLRAFIEVENYSSVNLVALVAKTLNKLRPRVTTFNLRAIYLTSACSELLKKLIEILLESFNDDEDNEINWLRGIASCLSPLTCRYMTLLWTKWDKIPPLNKNDPAFYWSLFGFGRGIELIGLDEKERFAIVSAIVKILPLLTMSEWEQIGCNDLPEDKSQIMNITTALFFILADCVLILFQLPFMLQDTTCLGHILTNFLHFTQINIIRNLRKINEEQNILIQNKVEQICNQLPEKLMKTAMPHLVLLQKSITNSEDFNLKITEMLNHF